MKATPKFSDVRLDYFCIYCGSAPGTRDHVPSRVLLDKPYPDNMPVVPCCSRCNSGFSLDEEYFACLIECVLCGSTEPAQLNRDVIKSILKRKPALRDRIAHGMVLTKHGATFQPEWDRLERVAMKQLRGHAQFENSEAQYSEPDFRLIKPLVTMTDEESAVFWAEHDTTLLPEIGSRGFHRDIQRIALPIASWQVVQASRYQYSVDFTPDGATRVRIVMCDYLACMGVWED